MYNKERKDSGYAFFDVDNYSARAFISAPHQVKTALINCKIAADSSMISDVQKEEMKRKLYVSNLPPNSTDLDLVHLFENFGELTKAYLVRNRTDGSCKNFGFVIFKFIEDMQEFLSEPRVLKFKGRKLTIKQAVDRQTQKNAKTSPDCSDDQLRGQSGRLGTCHLASISAKTKVLKRSKELDEKADNYRLNHPFKLRRTAIASSPRSLAQLKTSLRPLQLSSELIYSGSTFGAY